MKHTQGPWNQTSESDSNHKLTGVHFIYDSNEGLGHVYRGVAVIKGKSKAENKANRDLICAAPEMLEALERMTSLLESIQRETGYITSVTQRDAKILIKKAKGE